MSHVNREAARQAILTTLAADTGADPSAFGGDGVSVVEWSERPGRRRYVVPAKPFQIVTIGRGFVISCHRDWLDPIRSIVAALDRNELVAPAGIARMTAMIEDAGEALAGPLTSYGGSIDAFRPAASPAEVSIELVTGGALDSLRSNDAFRHALPARPNPNRPDRLAVTARAGDTIVACAAASEENEVLWQVGVDVIEPWRGRGIGRAVVSRLTEAILDLGKVPYYTHTVSNIPSAALATSLGYWPAWVQWHAMERR